MSPAFEQKFTVLDQSRWSLVYQVHWCANGRRAKEWRIFAVMDTSKMRQSFAQDLVSGQFWMKKVDGQKVSDWTIYKFESWQSGVKSKADDLGG